MCQITHTHFLKEADNRIVLYSVSCPARMYHFLLFWFTSCSTYRRGAVEELTNGDVLSVLDLRATKKTFKVLMFSFSSLTILSQPVGPDLMYPD